MRFTFLCFLLLYVFSSQAQTKLTVPSPKTQTKSTVTSSKAQAKPTIDKRFVGSWSGSEKGQEIEGLEKHWIQHRFEDGTFLLLFTILEDGEIRSTAEKGKWWVENNEFHELHFNSGMTDIYTFSFVDEDSIKFKSKIVLGEQKTTYEFVDVKLEDY